MCAAGRADTSVQTRVCGGHFGSVKSGARANRPGQKAASFDQKEEGGGLWPVGFGVQGIGFGRRFAVSEGLGFRV